MKSTGHLPTLGVLVLLTFAPDLLFGQQQKEVHPVAQSCAGQNCDNVTVDDVSVYNGHKVSSITASGGRGLYILSCWSIIDDTCVEPAKGQVYGYSEKPSGGEASHVRVGLAGLGTSRGEYELDVFVPLVPAQSALRLLRACQSKDRFSTPGQCAMWLRRQIAMARASCPEPIPSAGCQSLKGLAAAGDPELMDDLATKDHVYACFLPSKDEFFEITFTEPELLDWKHSSSEDQQSGIPDSALVSFGGAQLLYFKDGLVDPDRTFQELGKWAYLPLGHENDMNYLERFATSDTSKFYGKNIHIELGRFDFSEEFKNKRGAQTTHTISVQLATGRFTEVYEASDTKSTPQTISGRCLIVPNEKH